jgi:O-acetyl-ADP-ribose deacetylase (regulator of RNase III)
MVLNSLFNYKMGEVMVVFEAVTGDLTTLKVDVIVNAANSSLLGGGGVDGAIHRAAGPELLRECRHLGGCRTGEAKLTAGYNLPASYVVHTVGPIYSSGSAGQADQLASCYSNSLRLAESVGASSVAFPAISTGVYGYPKQEAAEIAVRTVTNYFNSVSSSIQKVLFVCFSESDYKIYQPLLK